MSFGNWRAPNADGDNKKAAKPTSDATRDLPSELNRDLADPQAMLDQLNDLTDPDLATPGALADQEARKNDDAAAKDQDPLRQLNDLAGDLGPNQMAKLGQLGNDLSQGDPKKAAKQAAKQLPKDLKAVEKDPLKALNDLGGIGSLTDRADTKHAPKPQDQLAAMNNLVGDLDPQGKHKPNQPKLADRLAGDELGALSLGGLDKPVKADSKSAQLPGSQFEVRGPMRPLHQTVGDFLKGGFKNALNALKSGAKAAFTSGTSMMVHGIYSFTGRTVAKATAAKLLVASMALPVGLGGGAIAYAVHQNNVYQVLDEGQVCGVANDAGTGFADAVDEAGTKAVGGSGDLKSGGIAEKHAKSVFKAWVDLGLSGAAASGIVGWVNTEGGFSILDRAQGHFGSDEKTNGVSEGVTPVGGGAGIYQFTPYTKFAPLRDKKWLSASEQNKFVKDSIVKHNDWNLKYELSGHNWSFKQFAHASDPSDACLAWDAYEKGDEKAVANAKSGKIADAKWVYKHFNGSKYQANDSLLGKLAGGVADDNSATAEIANQQACDQSTGSGGPVEAGTWAKPFPGFKKSMINSEQDFGPRSIGWHDGIDIGNATYTGTIHAIHGGRVVKIGCQGSTQHDLGYYIIVQSPDGYSEIYQEFAFSMEDGKKVSKVKEGDSVKSGQGIAVLSKSTPIANHIHIGVFKGSAAKLQSEGWPNSFTPNYPKWIDPLKMIKG